MKQDAVREKGVIDMRANLKVLFCFLIQLEGCKWPDVG